MDFDYVCRIGPQSKPHLRHVHGLLRVISRCLFTAGYCIVLTYVCDANSYTAIASSFRMIQYFSLSILVW